LQMLMWIVWMKIWILLFIIFVKNSVLQIVQMHFKSSWKRLEPFFDCFCAFIILLLLLFWNELFVLLNYREPMLMPLIVTVKLLFIKQSSITLYVFCWLICYWKVII
jgi:hypothetical protein